MQQTEGVLGISYANREKNLGFTEEQIRRLNFVFRKRGDTFNVYDKTTMIVYHSPTEGSADEVSYISDKVDDGMHVLLNASYSNQNELNTFRKSEFWREFSRKFELGEIYGRESGEGIYFLPPEEKYRHFRIKYSSKKKPSVDLNVSEFFIRKGDFTHKLINTQKLTFLQDSIPAEPEEPAVFLHFDLIPEENVSIQRRVVSGGLTPDVRKLLRIGEDGKPKYFGGYTQRINAMMYDTAYFDTDSNIKIDDLAEVNLKVGIFRRRGDYGALVHVVGFNLLIPENFEIVLKMQQESAKSRPHVLRTKEEKGKHIASDISIY